MCSVREAGRSAEKKVAWCSWCLWGISGIFKRIRCTASCTWSCTCFVLVLYASRQNVSVSVFCPVRVDCIWEQEYRRTLGERGWSPLSALSIRIELRWFRLTFLVLKTKAFVGYLNSKRLLQRSSLPGVLPNRARRRPRHTIQADRLPPRLQLHCTWTVWILRRWGCGLLETCFGLF